MQPLRTHPTGVCDPILRKPEKHNQHKHILYLVFVVVALEYCTTRKSYLGYKHI